MATFERLALDACILRFCAVVVAEVFFFFDFFFFFFFPRLPPPRRFFLGAASALSASAVRRRFSPSSAARRRGRLGISIYGDRAKFKGFSRQCVWGAKSIFRFLKLFAQIPFPP